MPTLICGFVGRRYHATPWGHHVNEGLIEWPPSPWRLLRALLATGYATLGWPSAGPPDIACGLVEKLASVLPRYRLPRGAGAHSRHYMPLARFKGGREDTTLVFDTWAQVAEAELAVSWDVALDSAEHALLVDLADRMSYLGRAESWVLARLAAPGAPLPAGSDCVPCNDTASPGPGWEQVPLMAAQLPESYVSWRQEVIAAELAKLPKQRPTARTSKKALEAQRKAEEPYPPDLLACLQTTTNFLRQHGWSQPPGSRRVFYWRRADAIEAGAPRLRTRQRTPHAVEAMLLAMSTTSGNDHALPHVTRTLPQADLLHNQLVGHLGGRNNPALTGCDELHQPLRQPHIHAHVLPLDLDGDSHLEHILIWAPMGLDSEAQAAVRAVRKTFTKGGVGPLKLALVGTGRLEELAARLPPPPGTDQRLLPSLINPRGDSRVWKSITPFVPPRYVKQRGRNTLEGQVVAELASRHLPAPVLIRLIEPRETPNAMQMRHFVRNRRRGQSAPIDWGFALELRFDAPVKGPICLGYGSHYGLGLFACE